MDLFDDAPQLDVPGLIYQPDYIDSIAETSLLTAIDAAPWITDLKRRVQHYGWRYDYKARSVPPDAYLGPLPDWLTPLAHRLADEGLFGAPPDQAIINEYLPGQGIAPHIDCEPCFGPVIASLSLGGSCVMVFSREERKAPITLAPRSMVVMTGEARELWKHGIPARKSDPGPGGSALRGRRVSVTFRVVNVRNLETSNDNHP
ncbi:MAG: alpha-ketoglutarate-dependent dioxygenase AlkB [Rhodobacteraceae bacterium]|nr:alpha-ketoglutarate-dependent dioxygenase AlkB [Paracoccaceae bacterium]